MTDAGVWDVLKEAAWLEPLALWGLTLSSNFATPFILIFAIVYHICIGKVLGSIYMRRQYTGELPVKYVGLDFIIQGTNTVGV